MKQSMPIYASVQQTCTSIPHSLIFICVKLNMMSIIEQILKVTIIWTAKAALSPLNMSSLLYTIRRNVSLWGESINLNMPPSLLEDESNVIRPSNGPQHR